MASCRCYRLSVCVGGLRGSWSRAYGCSAAHSDRHTGNRADGCPYFDSDTHANSCADADTQPNSYRHAKSNPHGNSDANGVTAIRRSGSFARVDRLSLQ